MCRDVFSHAMPKAPSCAPPETDILERGLAATADGAGMTVLGLEYLSGKYRLCEHKRKATCFHMRRKNIYVEMVYGEAYANTAYGRSFSSGQHMPCALGYI